ncbi:hypothetical protein NLG97_g4942 [Lecanicillium saksenae]|uniref:Uncharacterized protein n=1 Tax=Lecanicillium saksenae TaxID=468837 RepID=A0ACC1QU15_9HYPO|nr:hypothetical protein NLG97_g4942 [Lecanicillium saksenae]
MEFTANIEPFTSPRAPFMGDPQLLEIARFCEEEYQESRKHPNASVLLWDHSTLNPRNRVDTLTPSHFRGRWRVDGCAGMGRHFFAVPDYMRPDVPVKYITVIIPCQSQQPHALRRGLCSSDAAFTPNSRIGDLGISRYLVDSLDLWSSALPHFDDIYRNIPFGSAILLDNLTCSPRTARLRFAHRDEFHRQLVNLDYLKAKWKLPSSVWPPTFPVSRLCLVKQLSATVCIVQLAKAMSSKQYIFKTNLIHMSRIYHELKVHMQIHSHENIIQKPLFIIESDEFGQSAPKVLGFLLDFIPGRTLGDTLELRTPLSRPLQLNWAIQIVTALLHIRRGPSSFYSDLKPDNILVLSPNNEQLILIDLEQGGNWDAFSAPEIMYTSWMKKLACEEDIPGRMRAEYQALMSKRLPRRTQPQELYSDPPHGYYDEWTNLEASQQESAMVFALGKVLWCIFEECSHTSNSLGEKYTQPVDIEFPAFKRTPEELRALILQCTTGAPELEPGSIRMQRDSCRLVSLTDDGGGKAILEASPAAVLEQAGKLMNARLRRMEAHQRSWVRSLEGHCDQAALDSMQILWRPTLQDVLEHLQEYLESMEQN